MACIANKRLFTLGAVKRMGSSGNRFGDSGRRFRPLLAAAIAAAGCGVKTVYLHDGNQALANVAVVVWSAPGPPADAPAIALAKIDDKKLDGGAAPMNRAELLPGTHDFMGSSSACVSAGMRGCLPGPRRTRAGRRCGRW